MDYQFTIEGLERQDGLVKFTCAEMPGFRLLLTKQEDENGYAADVTAAIRQFFPLFFAAEARSKRISIAHKEPTGDGNRKQGFKLLASMAI